MGAILEDISKFFRDPVVATLHESKTRIAQVLNDIDGFGDLDNEEGVGMADQGKGAVEQLELSNKA